MEPVTSDFSKMSLSKTKMSDDERVHLITRNLQVMNQNLLINMLNVAYCNCRPSILIKRVLVAGR